jgi:hypothetical protein
MLEKTFSLFVYLKKPKFYKDNDPYQIYLRITVDGTAIKLSVNGLWIRTGRAVV